MEVCARLLLLTADAVMVDREGISANRRILEQGIGRSRGGR